MYRQIAEDLGTGAKDRMKRRMRMHTYPQSAPEGQRLVTRQP